MLHRIETTEHGINVCPTMSFDERGHQPNHKIYYVNGCSGKGAVEFYAAVVKRGTIIFELAGLPMDVAKEACRLAAHKLPVSTKFVFSTKKTSANFALAA
jgi:ribosomal protein L16/L10AE